MQTISSSNAKFVYASYRERFYAASNQWPNFENFNFTPVTGYDSYDCTYTVFGKPCVVEFKVRDFASDKYDSAMIDKKKFDYLIEHYKRTGETPIYQMYYTDGICILWDLLKCQDVPLEETTANRYTMNPTAGKIKKQIYNLPNDKGLKLKYNIPSETAIRNNFNAKFTVV